MTAELVWAVVAAAGDGRRLGQERPKAFAKLGGRPLLAHAVELFEAHPRVERVVVVVPEGWEEPATLLADELAAGKVAAAVPGGATRALSVAAGLAAVGGDAEAIIVTDTVKRVQDGVVAETLERGELRAVQTPQAFRAAALRRAYEAPADAVRDATDCASLVEAAGFAVAAVAGEPENVKITAPDDLAGAEARLA